MRETYPQGLYEQHLKCVEFCRHMQKKFPELRQVRGHVYSRLNLAGAVTTVLYDRTAKGLAAGLQHYSGLAEERGWVGFAAEGGR
jgi:hypothetical protein